MAPILSKAAPPPPKDNREKLARALHKATSQASKDLKPLMKNVFDIIKEAKVVQNLCTKKATVVLDRVRQQLDHVCIGAVRILESLCCLDVNRFAKPERPLTGSLPILFVVAIVIMLYNAFVFGYMPAAGIPINSRESMMFHAWIFMLLASFAKAVRTDPGTCPTGARWRDKENPPPEATEKKRGSNEARWCRKSEAYKPDRAHYCRVLQKGVLRMDHYCPWLGNTVGFHNQKFFFLFLVYTNAACGQLGWTFLKFLVEYSLPAMTGFCLIGAEALTLLISSLLVPFFLFHMYLIGTNTTTIEFCEKMRSRNDEKETAPEGEPLRYDLGIIRNLQAVLGSNPLLWLLPVGGPSGDGIKYQLNPAYVAWLKAQKAANDEEEEEEEEAQEDVDADPEATHPVADSELKERIAERKKQLRAKKGQKGGGGVATVRSSRGAGVDLEGTDGDIERISEEGSQSEASEASSSGRPASNNPEDEVETDFLVWCRHPVEFVEDLAVGSRFIASKSADCGKASFAYFLASCVPGGRSLAPWTRTPTSDRNLRTQRQNLQAVRVAALREKKQSLSNTQKWIPEDGASSDEDIQSMGGVSSTVASTADHRGSFMATTTTTKLDRQRALNFLSD